MSITTKKIGSKYIRFKSGVKGTMTEYTSQVLADIMEVSGDPHIQITSMGRTFEDQMNAMYSNIVSKGTASQYELYGSNGDDVIDVYVASKAAGKTAREIKSDMLIKVEEVWEGRGHVADPSVLQVVDISIKSENLKDIDVFLKAIKQVKEGGANIKKYIDERPFKINAIHIEIIQENTETSESVLKGALAKAAVFIVTAKSKKVVSWTNSGEHTGKYIDDLTDDVKDFPGYGMKAEEAEYFEHEGITNHRRMWMALSFSEKIKSTGNPDGAYSEDADYTISNGLTLYIPITEVSTVANSVSNAQKAGAGKPSSQTNSKSNSQITEYESNITSIKTNEAHYYPKLLKYISLDPGYVPAFKNRGVVSKSIYPRLKVYAFSKVLYLESGGNSSLIDVTPCVQAMNISSTFEGSEFNIKLSPMIGRLRASTDTRNWKDETWGQTDVIDIGNGESIKLGNINREVVFQDPRVGGNTTTISEYVRNHQFYEKIFQQNDMFFIRFEQLESDSDEDIKIHNKVGGLLGEDTKPQEVWYDLIGLVDYVEVTSNAASTDVSINIIGRDLTKALIEDNSYFNAYSAGHSESIYGGVVGSNGRHTTNEFKEVAVIADRSIKQSMEFIFHRIASIGYVPDSALVGFPNRTMVTVHRGRGKSDDDENTVEIKPARGIWQLVKFWIDDDIRNLRLVDDSIARPHGSIWDLMKKVCQPPFIELFTETLGSQFYIIARRPPFERAPLSKIVNDIQLDTTSDPDNYKGSYEGGGDEGKEKSAYKKYLDCLEKKGGNIVNSWVRFESSPSGFWDDKNKKNQLDKLKAIRINANEEKKYLERYGVIIVNDKVVGCNEELNAITSNTFPLIVNINEDDVFRDNFRMTQTAYAWYEVKDKGSLLGQKTSIGQIPAVYFDEYAQVFGNRKLEVTNNYSDFRFFDTKEKESNSNIFADQASQLLAFLVETNIHLPFTREGSFVTNGDRRIKKGNYIYYRPTREIFYVDRVENNITMGATIDRTTTVTVSRGMIIDYIDGVEEEVRNEDGSFETKLVSYFNIVDIPKLKDGIYDVVDAGSATEKFDHKANFNIDVSIMNFFLQRRQFKEHGI